MVAEGLLYTKEHEWIKIEGDNAIVGITDHAQEMLGEITYAELPKIGRKLETGAEMAVVESSKAASDVFAPVGGEVVEINQALETKPELINEDCYKSGWICKLKISDKDAAKKLMSAKEYEEYLKGL